MKGLRWSKCPYAVLQLTVVFLFILHEKLMSALEPNEKLLLLSVIGDMVQNTSVQLLKMRGGEVFLFMDVSTPQVSSHYLVRHLVFRPQPSYYGQIDNNAAF